MVSLFGVTYLRVWGYIFNFNVNIIYVWLIVRMQKFVYIRKYPKRCFDSRGEKYGGEK